MALEAFVALLLASLVFNDEVISRPKFLSPTDVFSPTFLANPEGTELCWFSSFLSMYVFL